MFRRLLLLLFALCLTASYTLAQVERVQETGPGISARLQHEINITKDPALGYVPKARLVNAYIQRKERLRMAAGRSALLNWVERGPDRDVVGPSNGNTRAGNGITAGRLRAIWEDLGDATGKTVWTGGIDGGLWKTTDITATPPTWTPINDFFGNLAVASICQDPTDHNTMYFGTGEKAINADGVRGAGIWRSLDHGVTWALMPGTENLWNVSKIVCDASGNLYVGCNSLSNNQGIQRYTKATGVWTNITPSGLDARVPDIELSSTGRLHVVCGYFNSTVTMAGHRYTDNPATVTPTTWTAPITSYSPRQYNVDIASNGNTLYALPANSSWGVTLIYKSTNGGANWTVAGVAPKFTSGQTWYCMGIAVDPNNANNVIIGSLDCFKSTNAGASWTKISYWVGTTGQYVHADQQIITWRSNNQVLVGSDGGVHYSPNGGSTFTDKNIGLRIKQFYSVAIHPTETDYILGGTQDNGVHQLNSPGLASSVEVTGGDGGFVHIDQDQPYYQWGSNVYNNYRRSTDNGASWSYINQSSSTGRFINPTDYDDANNIMYCSGAQDAFLRWNNPQSGNSFTSVSMSMGTGTISAVKVSPYSNHTVYFGGGRGGVNPTLIKATNANATPTYTNIIGSAMLITSANISSIELGTDENNIIACFSNYGVNNVWVTSNGGASWSAIDGNLPDMPVRWAMFYPGDNSKAIIATETGIWQTELINGSSTIWDPETGFPNVRTDMLQYRASDQTIVAATHGRGMFTATLSGGPVCGTPSGLNASAISISSANVTWAPVSGAVSYDVDYKLASSGTWINAHAATTEDTVALTGLNENSLYDWRVRANCAEATSSYSSSQFTTLSSTPPCGTPTTLSASNITSSSAIVSWFPVSEAVSHDVDYKLATDTAWVNAATATTSDSVTLTGLSENSLYDWRVRTNCAESSSAYVTAQFTTFTSSCGTVTGLTSSAITSSSATVSWSTVSGANHYDVDYKQASSSTWINAASATTALSANLTGLAGSTLYDWRVRANCTGISGEYAQAQFTTTEASVCPGEYDVSTNGTSSGAASVPFSTDIYGLIDVASDLDYYKFVITNGGTISITLTNLPANYSLRLYKGASLVAISQNTGTANETINYNAAPSTYYARVSGYNNSSHPTLCYTLRVNLGTASGADLGIADYRQEKPVLALFPNPAQGDRLSVYIGGYDKDKIIEIISINGRKIFSSKESESYAAYDISGLSSGLYIVRIRAMNGKVISQQRFVKE